jgi:hypothetical protein
MEGRCDKAVWLELAAANSDEYSERARAVRSTSGVRRGWWGSNANPMRTDLPRKLNEFSTLGVYEVDDGFRPPAVSDGTTGLHFVRTARPGQGILTGSPTTGILLVLISPKTRDGAAALRDWADFVHIRHIVRAAVPGYCLITPYESADGSDPLYLHLYEMDSDDPERTYASMTPLVEGLLGAKGSPAFDDWAWHKELRILYVNTFARSGVV